MDDAVKQQARWRWQEVAEARKIEARSSPPTMDPFDATAYVS